MSFYAISALTNALTSIVLGVLTFLSNPRDAVNRSWFIATIAVAVWSFAYFMWQISVDAESALYWVYWLMMGSIFISPTYFHFTASLIGRFKELRWWVASGYIQALFFLYFLQSSLFIRGVVPRGGFQFWPVPGVLYDFFILLSWTYIIAAVVLLFRKRRSLIGTEQARITYILIGTFIGFIGGYTNYFLFFNIPVPPFGNIGTSIYMALVAYAILRHQLFNMKVIATELLIFSLWLFLFVRMLLENTLNAQLGDLALLLVTLIIGMLLIRSVDREVEQREEIERLSNEKSEFMSFASHEIRNPITAMRGYASLIVDGTVEDGQAKGVAQKILVNGDTVLSLISEFLNKSKVELGQISYSVADVDIGKTIESIGEGFQAHAREKGLALDIRVDFPGLKARADEPKLCEVIGNLIDNSVKYTKTGTVTLAVEKRNGMARVVISDTGVGIPPETLPKLFQKFSRADAQKMNLLGTGLGLYLAKTFIEGMGGKIWAESDGKDKGSRFIIELHAV